MLTAIICDGRIAVRRMRAKPSVALSAVAMLGIAIGLATAMFAIADALLIRPLPFDGADRMSLIYMGNDRGGRSSVAPAVLNAWRSSPVFDAAFGVSPVEALVETRNGPRATQATFISPDALGSLGVRILRGRLFDAAEGREGTTDRVLLSEDFWRSAFDADPALVGRLIDVDDRPMLVVGILPSDFRFPAGNTVMWMPMDFDAPPADAALRPISYVWFTPGVPRPDAVRMATDLAHNADPTTVALRVRDQPVVWRESYDERALPLLAGGVSLVFIVLCANVTGLLLTQQMNRQRELSVIAALGASSGRMIRQAAAESLCIGVGGSLAGVVSASALVQLARRFLPEAMLVRTLNTLELDWRALAVACLVGAIATGLAGILPTFIGTRVSGASALQSHTRAATQTRLARAATLGLMTTEVALAFALLVGTALLGQSFLNLVSTDRGLDPRGVIASGLILSSDAFPDRASRAVAINAVRESLLELPSVRDVVLSSGVPPSGAAIHYFDDWRSDAVTAANLPMVSSYRVSPGFFSFYGIPIVAGRSFRPDDTDRDVIIGERMAAALWPETSPVGRTFETNDLGPLRVIGIARETTLPSLDSQVDRPEFYYPFEPGASTTTVSIRCNGPCPNPAEVSQRIRRAHPNVSDFRTRLVEQDFVDQLGRPRAAAGVALLLGVVALLAAAGGLFSVLSYSVGLREREFGIRAALGATRASLWRVVFREGAKVIAVGLGVGALLAWWFARLTMSLQYGVTPNDPLSWIAVAVVLLLTSVAAAWRPARRAGRADPAWLLRAE